MLWGLTRGGGGVHLTTVLIYSPGKINAENDKNNSLYSSQWNSPTPMLYHIPGLLILSILSKLGEVTQSRGLLWLELSDPTSLNESSSVSKSSFTHLWQILCWQGRINGWVNSSLHAGQMSSLSIFLMVTWNWNQNQRLLVGKYRNMLIPLVEVHVFTFKKK